MFSRDAKLSGNRRPRILVVDDDPWMRGQIVATLRQDYFVLVATDGSEGYIKSLEYPPALAVIDIQMQGWNGFKTLRMFRSHGALATTRILVLTADASRAAVLAAIRDGADDYVTKSSFTRDALLKSVERLLRLGPKNSPVTDGHCSRPEGALALSGAR